MIMIPLFGIPVTVMMEYKQYDDFTLFLLLKAHDQRAFGEIYSRFSVILLRFALQSMKGAHDAEDVVHDVFMQLWERRDSIEIHTSVSSFLYRAVLNEILNRVKRIRLFDLYVDKLVGLPEPVSNSTIDLIEEKELVAKFESGLENLPPKMRLAFEYSRFEGLSHETISEKMGISKNTVKSHIKSALRALRKRIGRPLLFFF